LYGEVKFRTVTFRPVSFGLVMSHCHVVCVMSRDVALLSTVPSCSVLSHCQVVSGRVKFRAVMFRRIVK